MYKWIGIYRFDLKFSPSLCQNLLLFYGWITCELMSHEILIAVALILVRLTWSRFPSNTDETAGTICRLWWQRICLCEDATCVCAEDGAKVWSFSRTTRSIHSWEGSAIWNSKIRWTVEVGKRWIKSVKSNGSKNVQWRQDCFLDTLPLSEYVCLN